MKTRDTLRRYTSVLSFKKEFSDLPLSFYLDWPNADETKLRVFRDLNTEIGAKRVARNWMKTLRPHPERAWITLHHFPGGAVFGVWELSDKGVWISTKTKPKSKPKRVEWRRVDGAESRHDPI